MSYQEYMLLHSSNMIWCERAGKYTTKKKNKKIKKALTIDRDSKMQFIFMSLVCKTVNNFQNN